MRITTIIALAICVIGLLAAAGLRPSGALAGPLAQAVTPTPSNQATVAKISFTGTRSAGSSYADGERIRITVKFDRVVTVTGAPYVNLQVGAHQRPAAYSRGSGTQFLRFAYRVQSGDFDGDGVSVPAGAVNLNGGTIRSTGGDAALTHLGIAVDDTRTVNDTQPTFGAASIANQNYTTGQVVSLPALPAATGGNAPLAYSLSKPPAGLTFNAATRVLSGTPTAGQTATAYTYTVTDADGDTATLSFTIAITADYDADDDQLLEVDNLAQLDAIRYDLDGNGAVDTGIAAADAVKYTAAFPNPIAGMGCKLVDHDDDAATGKTPVCIGYELTQNLDFDTDDDGATYAVSATGAVAGDADDAYYNGGKGWTPMGTHTAPFTATFDGDGKIISNLFINRTATDTGKVGLFGHIGASGAVRDLGLIDVNITGPGHAGSLAGSSDGTVTNCYAAGSVASLGAIAAAAIGGLVGRNSGTITSSYAAVTVSGRTSAGTGWDLAGGLVGKMRGSTAAITASYATGAVSTSANVAKVGGLVGNIYQGATIISSYATGSVSGSGSGNMVGGLVGWSGTGGGSVTASYATGTVTVSNSGYAGSLYGMAWGIDITDSYATGAVNAAAAVSIFGLLGRPDRRPTNSYWDTGATGQPSGVTRPNGVTNPHGTNDPHGGQGKTTRELQSPTSNTGIYAGWQAAQWDFGTSRQYPAVKHNGKLVPGQRQTSIQSAHWNAPLVGEPVTAGLNVTGATSIVWQWQSSANGAIWTNIAGATAASYIPVVADAASGGKFLRAQATFTLSGQSQTLTTVNTAKALAANTATPGAAATVLVMVGKPLHYHHASVTAAATANRTGWQWMRCDDAAMTVNCQLAQSSPATHAYAEYTPAAGTDTDVGKYLRAHAYYADSGNSNAWTRTQTPVLGPVLTVPAPAIIPSP